MSAAIGAIVRRSLAPHSTNAFLQPFCAALFAGVIGGAGGSVPIELFAAPGCGVPVHDSGAGSVGAQWRVGSHSGPHSSWRRSPDSMRGSRFSRSQRDYCLDSPFWVSPYRPTRSGEPCRCGWTRLPPASCRLLRRILLHAAAYAGVAGHCRMLAHALRWAALNDAGLRRRRRRVRRVSRRRTDPHSSRAPSAPAICGDWFRRRGLDASGCAPVPNGKRPSATYACGDMTSELIQAISSTA